MYTINIYLKLALIALTLIGGTVLAYAFGFWYAFPILLIGIGLLVSYIMLGTIQSAADMVQKEQFEEAENRLRLTLNPKFLYSTNRAFYYIIKGSIALFKGDKEGAETLFKEAQKIKLPTDNERAMVLLQLASINASKNKWNTAQRYYRELKKLNVTQKMIKDQIQQFDKAFQNRGVLRNPGMRHQGGFRQPGGKRRRPKSR